MAALFSSNNSENNYLNELTKYAKQPKEGFYAWKQEIDRELPELVLPSEVYHKEAAWVRKTLKEAEQKRILQEKLIRIPNILQKLLNASCDYFSVKRKYFDEHLRNLKLSLTAHISGFQGFGAHTIYHEDELPWYYRHRIDVYDFVEPSRAVPIDESEGKKIKLAGEHKGKELKKNKQGKVEEKKLEMSYRTFKNKYIETPENIKLYNVCIENPYRYYTLNDKQKIAIRRMKEAEQSLNSKEKISIERSEMFVKWGNQLARTMQAAIENPLKIIPMFHYEPRRWNGGKYDKKSSAHGHL
jgi:hypothetical protein